MKTFLQFSFAGAFGFLTDYYSLLFLHNWVSVHLARPFCFFLAVNVTYLINKNLAFKGKKASYGWYLTGQMKALVVNYLAFEGLLLALHGNPYRLHIAFVLAALLILLFNYTYARLLAFR